MKRIFGLMLAVIASLVIAYSAMAGPTADQRKLLDAMYIVESDSGRRTVGDDGRALGPYQIWRSYWQDALEFDPSIGGVYEDVKNKDYAERVILAYWARYATVRRLGRVPTMEDLARIHNGGPKGATSPNTARYWDKIQRALKQRH